MFVRVIDFEDIIKLYFVNFKYKMYQEQSFGAGGKSPGGRSNSASQRTP